MFECACSWLLLLVGICTGNANWFIASGVFAIAVQIDLYRKGVMRNDL